MAAKQVLAFACLFLICLFGRSTAGANIAPKKGVAWPAAYLERIRKQPDAFTYRRSLMPLMRRIRANREAVLMGIMTIEAAHAAGGIVVSGTKSIPVLTAQFNNTRADPYPVADLQKELFDGPWSTGTMTEYYQEISY